MTTEPIAHDASGEGFAPGLPPLAIMARMRDCDCSPDGAPLLGWGLRLPFGLFLSPLLAGDLDPMGECLPPPRLPRNNTTFKPEFVHSTVHHSLVCLG